MLHSRDRPLLGAGDVAGAEVLAAERFRRPRPGRVWLVGAGPGGPELLTLAARDVLATADVVFHDALVEPEGLALAGPGARLSNVGKPAGGRHLPPGRINAFLLEAAPEG